MRLQGIDIARFAAFVGMVLVNFRVAAGVRAVDDFPSAFTNLLEGRAAALFVLLAGVGIALARPSWHLTFRRALFLFVIGMANMAVFDADILHFYALYFLVAIAFLRATDRGLLVGAGGLILIGTLGLIFLDYERGWDWDTLIYSDFWTFFGFLRHSLLNGWHPVFPWAAFLLVGMWIGRRHLTGISSPLALIGGGVVGAAAFTGVSRIFTADPEISELMGLSPIPPGPLYMLAASATAVFALGFCLLVAPVLTRLRLAEWLAAPGRMALTLYVAHIYIGMGLLDALGLLNGSLTSGEIFTYALGFCLLSSLFARAWFARFKRGPLEAAMRLLTEGKR